MSITIEAKDASKFLRALDQAARRKMRIALQSGAERGRSIMVRRTPVDTGHMRAAWRVFMTALGNEAAKLTNDHPAIGVVEAGARPHPVSDLGILAIERWVGRHPDIWQGAQSGPGGRMLTREQAISAITHGIVWKLRTEGQEPTYFVRDALPHLRRAIAREVMRMMRELLAAPPKAGF